MFKKLEYKYFVAIIFLIAVCLELIDTFIVNIAFPQMALELKTDLSVLSWVVNAYLLSVAMFIPLSALLGEKYGTKKVFILAIFIFTLGSILCGFSTHVNALILSRALQGIGAGMLVPTGYTMILKAFPTHELMKIMSIITIPALLSPAIAQVLGGFIVENYGWKWIFFVNIPICILCFHMAKTFLIENELESDKKIDVVGIILSSVSFIVLFYALSCFKLNEPVTAPICMFILSLILMFVFIIHQLKISTPILDLRVFLNKHFRISIISFVLVMSACMGSGLVTNYFFQDTLQISAVQTGILSVPFCLAFLISSQILPKIFPKTGPIPILVFGITVYIIGNILMVFVNSPNDFMFACILNGIKGFGQGLLGIVFQSTALCSMEKSKIGSAASIFSIAWNLSVSFGVAFFTLLISTLMTLQGVLPVKFSSNYINEVQITFNWVYVISSVFYIVAIIVFFRINNKEVMQLLNHIEPVKTQDTKKFKSAANA